LVGSGGIARRHLSAFRQFPNELELAAVCDVREDAARKAAAAVGDGIPTYTSFEKLLDDGTFDAVDICTPHVFHAPQTIAAASARKHVLVEKPMACSIDESCAMVEAAEASKVIFMVGQSLRYLPTSAGVRRVIGSGALGEIWTARSDDWFPAMPPVGHWARDAKIAGGGVFHMGSTHRVDLFRYYFGEVGSVRARVWDGHPGFENGAEDRAVATLEFESGVVAQFSACWARYTTPHFFQYTILGDAGALYTVLTKEEDTRSTMASQHHAPAMALSHNRPGEIYEPVPPVYEGLTGDDPFINEIIHFASCVRSGVEPLSSGRDNIGTVKTVYACYESARTGREVQLGNI
jgi:UDP-N-acetylglucosamine 3-dehydrogenase